MLLGLTGWYCLPFNTRFLVVAAASRMTLVVGFTVLPLCVEVGVLWLSACCRGGPWPDGVF